MKKLLFISTTNLFSNPRLVKELKYFSNLNYEVSAIVFLIGIGDEKSEEIEQSLSKVKFIKLSALRKPFYSWFYSTIVHFIYLKIWSFFTNNITITAYAHNKRTIIIHQYLSKTNHTYNLIIAHTLGALFPAYKIHKKFNTPFVFDMEDFHPGELIKNDVNNEIERRKYLLATILHHGIYTTYASPLFIDETNKLLHKPLLNQLVIHNGFSSDEFILQESHSEKINFIWYSLTIAEGRGLELILPIFDTFNDKITLTLIGNLTTSFDQKYNITKSPNINYLGALPQKKLHQQLCKADVGLSLEQSTTDLNRDLCLTNKIISYGQAGLFILATPTKAQVKFIDDNSEFGMISTNFFDDINVIIKNIDKIKSDKKVRFNKGKIFSWDYEQKKLAKLTDHV